MNRKFIASLIASQKLYKSVALGHLLLLLIIFVYLGKVVLLPMTLGFLLMLVLQPLHNVLTKFLSKTLSALVVMAGLSIVVGTVVYSVTEPAMYYARELSKDESVEKIKGLLSPIQQLHTELTSVANKVDSIAVSEPSKDPSSSGEDATKVVNKVATPSPVEIHKDPMKGLYSSVSDIGFLSISTLVLTFFLLIHGKRIFKNIEKVTSKPDLLSRIQKDVSYYLLNITIINILLGGFIAAALWCLGMPNPLLWGVMAMMLNFIPYAGSLIGTVIVGLAAALHYQDLSSVMMVACCYLGLSAIEGNVITPLILGKKLEINPIIVFLWILIWAALWGLPGMLIGLPVLMVSRIAFSHLKTVEKIEEIVKLD